MYSPLITERMIAEASRRQGWELERSSKATIEGALAHFASLYDPEQGKMIRDLRPEENRFISNERKLCALDFRYWVAHYALIVNWEKKPVHPTLNVAQNIVVDLWAEHEERAIAIIMMHLKARQLGLCLDPSTKILTADLQWIAIDDVEVGTPIVAVDEYAATGGIKQQNARKMRTAVVEAKIERVYQTLKITLDTGRTVIATPQHPWLCAIRGSNGVEWRKTGALRIGDQIRKVTDVWEPGDMSDAWLGGLIDGEGSLRQKNKAGVELCVAQVAGDVLDRARVLMDARYAPIREEIDRREPGRTSKLGTQPVHKLVVGRMSTLFPLLGRTRPTRFIGRHWWEGKELPGKKIGSLWATVVAVEMSGTRRVVDLQTSTGTYIAEGIVSHNTTVYELADCHRFQFWPNSNVIIASADPKKTVEMGQMIKFCLDSQPWWLLPGGNVKYEKNMPVEFEKIHTRLSIQAGNQFHGVARGGTPNVGHLTEVSSWDNAEEDIDASFIRAVHETPDVFVGLESTGKGQDGWFPDTWNVVKEDWPRGRSRIRGEFLPWFVGVDIYPPAADLRARPIPNDWTPADRTIAHAERAREYVRSNPMLLKHLAKGNTEWKMPREQMWYYEIERDTALRKKTLNKFLEEMPADDTEAFQNTGISVIDQDIVLSYRDNVRHPLGVYAIVGPGIHQSLIPSRGQWLTGPGAPPPITVNVAGVCRSTEVYQFIPLKFEGYPGYDPTFKLFIYEWPEQGEVYGTGVDTSDGIGQDWSVVEGLRIGTPDRPHGQVCEYASPYIKADQLWPIALAISAFYSVFQMGPQRRVQCRVCVECRGNGEIVQHELKKRGWINFHPWKKYDNKRRLPDGKVHKEGVFTNVWFRSMMLDKFLTAVDEQAIELNSYWLVKELGSLERDPDEKSARAAYNTHDDRIIAICFPLFSLTVDLKPLKSYGRATPQYLPEALDASDQMLGQYAIWQPPSSASSALSTSWSGVSTRGSRRQGTGSFRPRSGGGW